MTDYSFLPTKNTDKFNGSEYVILCYVGDEICIIVVYDSEVLIIVVPLV